MRIKHQEPIHKYRGKWWFWDEVWTNRIGPFKTKKEATQAITIYAKELEEGRK